jgi:beta-phosphoglucomutase-like phosphatase (HAD superfamily)
MSERLKGFISDVDGFLADTSPMLIDWYNNVLDEAGYVLPVSIEDVMQCFHMSKRDAIKTLARVDDSTQDGRDEIEKLLKIASKTPRDTGLIIIADGAEDFLYRAREKVSLSVATNGGDETPPEVFDKFKNPDTISLFSGIFTADSGHALKPAPDMLNAAMDSMGTNPAETAFGGDSLTDVDAGAEAGVITMTIPRKGEQPIKEADVIACDFDELYLVVRAMARARVFYSYKR